MVVANKRENNNIIERQCTQCQEWKPETTEYYYMHNKSKPEKGFQPECKKCAIKRASKNRIDNIEIRKAYDKQRYLNDPNYFYTMNKKDFEERSDFYKNFMTAWRRDNLDKVNQYSLNHRQHKKHNITNEQWIACKEYFKDEDGNYCCAYCGLRIQDHNRMYAGKIQYIDLHKEHIDDDGSNELDNCIPSCQSCNSSKREYEFEEWYNSNNDRRGGEVFTQERLDKIIKWTTEDYKQYLKS